MLFLDGCDEVGLGIKSDVLGDRVGVGAGEGNCRLVGVYGAVLDTSKIGGFCGAVNSVRGYNRHLCI